MEDDNDPEMPELQILSDSENDSDGDIDDERGVCGSQMSRMR